MRRRIRQVNDSHSSEVPKRSLLARLYLWACERLYDELAWWYDAVSWLVSAGQWRRWQSGAWEEVRGTTILEIGCGTGAMLAAGTVRNLRMVGVDLSPRMLAVAVHRISQQLGDIMIIQGSGEALPLGGNTFDTVLATFPASYIIEANTLAELHRVLRDGGRLVLLGMWVELHIGQLERWLPVFYGRPQNATLLAIVQRVNEAGFNAQWKEQRQGWFTVGVLVAERLG